MNSEEERREAVIREIAHRLYEVRGIHPGDAYSDWVHAERLYEQASEDGAAVITVAGCEIAL